MQESKTKKTFVMGALLLGAAGVVVKLIGLFFRVPLTNIIGRAGMGYYQMAYPIYAAILAISTSGLPTAISRMISERRAVGKYYEAYRVFRVSFYVMLTLGVVTSVALFVFAPMIARIQGTPDAVYSHRAMALALLLCPILSCYRGFFQGHRNMVPTAVSQVVEQVFRAIIGLSLAAVLLKVDLPHAAAGGNFGASAGALFGLIAILFMFQRNRNKMMAEIRISGRRVEQSTAGITRELIIIALPITIGACIMPIVNGIDTLMVVDRLKTIGIAENAARELFAELSAMALPIANMPQIFTQAVVQSLVPVISDAFKRDDMDFVRHNANLGLRYAFLVALPCACGMAVLSRPVMQLFYPTQMEGVPNAAVCLCIYSLSLIFLASNQALSAVLQGIGKQNIPLMSLVAGAAAKVAVTFVLLGVKTIHVRGAAIGTVCAFGIAAFLNFRAVKRYTYTKFDLAAILIKPAIASAVMSAVVFGSYRLVHSHMGNTVSTFAAVLCGIIVYALMIFITRAITADEMASLPKLRKVASILKKLHLLK